MNIESTIMIWLEAWREHRDPNALSNLVFWQRDRAYNLARTIVGNASDAEDVVQQACMKLMSRRVGFDDPETFLRTLNRAVIQCGRDLCRARISRQAHTKRFAQRATPATTPSDPLVREDTTHAVRSALDLLEEDERLAVVLCYQEGCTVSEAARSLDVPRETLRYRLNRGTDKLRNRLANSGVAVGTAALFALLPQTGHAAPFAVANRIAMTLGRSDEAAASIAGTGASSASASIATTGSWTTATLLPGAAALIAIASATIIWSAPIAHATDDSSMAAAPTPVVIPAMIKPAPLQTLAPIAPEPTTDHQTNHPHSDDVLFTDVEHGDDHDDHDDEAEVELAVHEIPPQVLAAALEAVPGLTINESELSAEKGELIFEIEGVDANGQTIELEIETFENGNIKDVNVELENDDDRTDHRPNRIPG